MKLENNDTTIGVDLGGTKILSARVIGQDVVESSRVLVPKQGSEEEVIQALIQSIEEVYTDQVQGIGIGVPSIVDIEKGIVYNTVNIPSWKEVHLKDILEERFGVPVFVNNDANCFALGEKYFGFGQAAKNVVGLIIGTGMAAGIIIDGKLYTGTNCGAGEIGMISYRDKFLEYYASGQFFQNVHNCDGNEMFERAEKGEEKALTIFNEFGGHVGNAINTVLYSFDPDIIVIGGSVRKAYKYFKKAMQNQIAEFAYPSVTDKLEMFISNNEYIPVLGAAALVYDANLKREAERDNLYFKNTNQLL